MRAVLVPTHQLTLTFNTHAAVVVSIFMIYFQTLCATLQLCTGNPRTSTHAESTHNTNLKWVWPQCSAQQTKWMQACILVHTLSTTPQALLVLLANFWSKMI